jgi:NADPH:quinone reductase-like Zn-dependent oxidoreductase
LIDFDVPSQLAPDAVSIKVLATTATYTDQLIIRGNYRPCPPLPATPGYDLVGVVTGIGAAVTNVSVGDRVAAMPQAGCCATHVVLPAHLVIKVRADVSPADAVAVVLTGVTAYQMLHRHATVTPQSRLLIHACGGGTGAMLVELAKAAGVKVEHIFGTCSSKSRAVGSSLGIKTFDYKSEDWCAGVLAATGGAGVDAVFDSVVLGGYLRKGLACLRKGGAYVGYGVTNADAPGSLPLLSVISALTSLSFQNSFWRCFDGKRASFYNVADERARRPDLFAADLATLVDLVAAGSLRPVVGRVYSFEEAKLAAAAIEGNTHTGKQIIVVAEP